MAEQRSSAFVALAAIVLATAAAWLLLVAEHEWEVAALLACAAGAWWLGGRLGMGARVEASAAAHPRLVAACGWVALAALAFLLREDNFALLMLCTVMLYVTACLGLTLQFGFAGVVNFAGAAFFGIGAYTAAVLATHTGTPHLLVPIAGALVSAAIGSLLLLPLLRTRGHYAALITIAFGILFKTFLEVNDTLGGPQGLKVPGFEVYGRAFNDSIEIGEDVEWSFYLGYAALGIAVLAFAYTAVRRIERSWLGLAMDAVRIDEAASAAFGVNVAAWKIAAFSIGNFLAGLAGAVFAMLTGFVAPTSFTFGDSLILVSIVILGGVGNPLGLIPAALIVVVLPEKLQVIQEYRYLLFAALVIAILLTRPGGILPRRPRSYGADGSS